MNEKTFSKEAMNKEHPMWTKATGRLKELYKREDDIRSPFVRDYTRILHSLAYRRLKNKTQVFFNSAGNDHICTRIEHVSHVESVSNTIAKELGLNEELTRAIAMAHDLGHAPFGHQGERILDELTNKHLQEKFWHEKNGVYFVDKIELLEDDKKNLQNLNLTYAVRDGIISHCGEVDQNGLKPRTEYMDLSGFDEVGKYQAATWEGCVVKLADKIAYLGRDIEDAERLGYFDCKQKGILREMAKLRKQDAINTTVIMHSMILDLCKNSSLEKGLYMSEEMDRQMREIKSFNYEYIYKNNRLDPFAKYSKLVLNEIFEALLREYKGEGTIYALLDSKNVRYRFVREFGEWLIQYCEYDFSGYPDIESISKRCSNEKIYGALVEEATYKRAIIDFIAGMTDGYAISAFNELLGC